MTQPTDGKKDDTDKMRWSLLPFREIAQVVKVLQHGAQIYGDNNWVKVKPLRERYFNAAMRHITAWWEGETKDESGHHHLAHAMCCLIFLMWADNEEARGAGSPEWSIRAKRSEPK